MDDTELLRTIYRCIDWNKLYEEAPDLDRERADRLFGHLDDLLQESPRPVHAEPDEEEDEGGEMDIETAVLHTDGASRGNPGPGGAGIVLYTADGDEFFAAGQYLGKVTNNQAEYQAVEYGLKKALEMGVRRVTLRSDSQLLVRQVNGVYRVKSDRLRPLYERVKDLLARFEDWQAEAVPREQNKRADEEASNAAKKREHG